MSDAELLAATHEGLFDVESSGPIAFAGETVTALTASNGRLWAIVEGCRVYATTDHVSWSMVAERTDLELTCLLATPRGLFLGTEDAHLLRVDLDDAANPTGASAGELLPGFEAASDRGEWFTPWGGPPSVRSIAWDGGRTIYVNVHVGGILQSDDFGESFRQIIDIKTDVHEVIYHRDSGALLASTGRGFAVATADRWDTTCDGLHGCYMRAVTIADGSVIASASNGPHGDKGAIYRRPLGSRVAFEKCTDGLPEWFGGNVDTACVSASGAIVAAGAPRGSLYVSTNAGAEWDCARTDLSAITAVLVQ